MPDRSALDNGLRDPAEPFDHYWHRAVLEIPPVELEEEDDCRESEVPARD